MQRIGGCVLVFLLAVTASPGQDDKTPPTPKEQFNALVKEFSAKQQSILTEVRKAKGEEQQKLIQEYQGVGKDFADRFLKLADDNGSDPVAADAYFWIVQNGSGSAAFKKASEKVDGIVADMPAKDLVKKLNTIRQPNTALIDAVIKRADTDGTDPQAGDLLAWAATNGWFTPAGTKAINQLIEKFPEHKSIDQVCQILARGRTPNAPDILKQILEKATQPKIRSAAATALGKALTSKIDSLGDKPDEADKVAAEAEKYFAQALDLIGDSNAGKTKEIERDLKCLRTLRVGKEAPDIVAPDLDGKEFKLSDYRGKVVLLDFWGHW